MQTEIVNQYVAIHAVAEKDLTAEQPGGRTYRVPPGSVFLSAQNVAHTAALSGLVRAVNWATDRDADCTGDRLLFERHRDRFFSLPLDGAKLAVRIEAFKEPPAATVFHAFPQREPAPPVIRTGFEFPN